jgi:F-type H+-transporting ATPase subunit b
MEKLISEFSVGLFFWQSLIFLTLLFLLVKYAWKPILNAIKEREENIENALQTAEKAKKEIEELQAKNQDLLKEAREERDQILKAAKATKDKMISEAKNQAKVEGEKLIAQARNEINTQKNAALAEMKQMVASFSIEIAEKIMRKELGEKGKQEELVKTYLEDIKLN